MDTEALEEEEGGIINDPGCAIAESTLNDTADGCTTAMLEMERFGVGSVMD